MKKVVSGFKIILFLLIFCILGSVVGFFWQPAWKSWRNYDSLKGFYEQPENTINTIFLGASITINGVTPAELYENYGICAYNLGTSEQPMLATYYWAEEAYAHHPETLKNIVLDVSMLRRTPDIVAFQRALDYMHLSPAKYRAVRDYTSDLNERISYLFPLFEYHKRWSETDNTDVDKFSYEIETYWRGYNFSLEQFINREESEYRAPFYIGDASAAETQLENDSLYYLNKLIDFCKNNDITLTLIKTPQNWEAGEHNAVQNIADANGLKFFDFNYVPYIDEIEFNFQVDTTDDQHMNYYGARKLTSWIGKYLTEECGAPDIRGKSGYEFMEQEAARYNEAVSTALGYDNAEDVTKYIQNALADPDNTVFISVKDEDSASLTKEQREYFASIGLHKLSEISHRDSYVSVFSADGVLCEEIDTLESHPELWEENVVTDNSLEGRRLTKETTDAEKEEKVYIEAEGQLRNGDKFVIASGGQNMGNISSIVINSGEELSRDSRGMNIVVYNQAKKEVVDQRCFDTYADEKELGLITVEQLEEELKKVENIAELPEKFRKLYYYNVLCERTRFAAYAALPAEECDLLAFLDEYMNREELYVFLSVKDEASYEMTEEVRTALANRGLEVLSQLGYADSYIGIIHNNEIVSEQRDHGSAPIRTDGLGYTVISGGAESGNVSSIIINQEEYSPDSRGINVAVFDAKNNCVIAAGTFDTYQKKIKLTEASESTE